MKELSQENSFAFGTYRLDLVDERLWRQQVPVELRPKAFNVLRYLVEHAGKLVTKDALMEAVWGQTLVSEATLTGCLREIRKALGDNAQTPEFIETVHRRGYRFIAKVKESNVGNPKPTPQLQSPPPSFVGREAEVAQLQEYFDRTQASERQIVFLSGEAGIGKTTLLQAFLSQVGRSGEARIGRGQCIEQYGAGEAYMPMLEALGRLCREPDGEQLIELLSQHAPTWLVQMPALLSTDELETLQRKVQGATQERMLREMAEALEALTSERPLVLTLEDLHWSDHATLELLSTLARRQERARLLVLGTYRPVDVIIREHPLKEIKQELVLHRQCEELPLSYLTEAAVGEYLTQRFPAQAQDDSIFQELTRLIYQRTDGNPLFMVNAVDYAVREELVVETESGLKLKEEDLQVGVPATLRQMVERQLERLAAQARRVLEVASVAGAEFSAVAVAAGLGAELVMVEEQCAELARQGHFIRAAGVQDWPDGTVASRYHFVHAMYQEVLYERVAAARRVQLHRQIGQRLEAGYGEQAGKIAAELAVHFEQGRDFERAVSYRLRAGQGAVQRSANVEAIHHFRTGVEVLNRLPDTPERTRQELSLQTALGGPMIATKGFAEPEVGAVYTRARELCRQIGESPQLAPILWGLCGFHTVRAEHYTAHEIAEELLHLAQSVQDPALRIEAHYAVGQALYFRGDFAQCRVHMEQLLALYDRGQHHSLAYTYGYDPGVMGETVMAYALWHLGYPEQARQRIQEMLLLAQALSHPNSLAWAFMGAAVLHQYRGEGGMAQEHAESLMRVSDDHGYALLFALGKISRGMALATQKYAEEGIAQLQEGLATHRATGSKNGRPLHNAWLAWVYGEVGKPVEGLTLLTEALEIGQNTGERRAEAEIYRLKGELTLRKLDARGSEFKEQAEAEGYFLKAIEIAEKQRAKSWELRAATSLARLWQQQGKQTEARDLLAPVYGWFTEGFDTADLKDAKALLDQL